MQKRIASSFYVLVLMSCLSFFTIGSAHAQKANNAGNKEVIFRWTDKTPKLQFVGSWYFKHESAYTTKYQGNRDAKGRAICKPGISGRYSIFASFRATQNRGRAAKYLVDGKLVRTENQRSSHSGGSHSQKFPEVLLGTFDLNPDSLVVMKADDGQSYSFTQFRFTPSSGNVGPASETGSWDDVLGIGNSSTPDESEYSVTEDGDLIIEPYLTTYENAEFSVHVDDNEVLSWSRGDDTGRQLCVINGCPDENSMFEQKPGDYSPLEGLRYSIPVQADQKVVVRKAGNYLDSSYLRISGPVSPVSDADNSSRESSAGGAESEPLQSWSGSLWKPENHSKNGSVVLLAHKYMADYQAGKWQSAVLSNDPEGNKVVGGNYGNGRIVAPYENKHPAVRFDKLGSHFGSGPIYFVIIYKDGRRKSWKINAPAVRIEWEAAQ
jgi:hypothetical protein